MKKLGKVIVDRREELGMTGTDLAKKTGLSRAYISRVENGRVVPTRADTRRRIEEVLGLEPGELAGLVSDVENTLYDMITVVDLYLRGEATQDTMRVVTERAKSVLRILEGNQYEQSKS